MQNTAMLELVATLFLGLLLKIDMVNDTEEERTRVFDLTVTLVTLFIFVYPVVTMLFTSEKAHNLLSSRIKKLASKVSHMFERKKQPTATTTNASNTAVEQFDAVTDNRPVVDSSSVSSVIAPGQATTLRKGIFATEPGKTTAHRSTPTDRGARYVVRQ